MSDEDRALIARLGPVDAAVEAVNLALMSNGSGESDLTRLEAGDEDYLLSVIASLANLSALLARTVVRVRTGRNACVSDDAAHLLVAVRDDQEVRAAREELDRLDGRPFDA